MDVSVENAEEDYGTLVFRPSRDDDFSITGSGGGGIEIRIPLFAYQAKDVIAALRPVADAAPLT